MIKVNVYLTLEVDPEEYPIPSDGNLIEELGEGLVSYLYDEGGISVVKLKLLEKN